MKENNSSTQEKFVMVNVLDFFGYRYMYTYKNQEKDCEV